MTISGFLQEPESVNTTINSTVSFHCSSNETNIGAVYIWKLNSITYSNSLSLTSTLNLIAVSDRNGSTIQCLYVVTNDKQIQSNIAVLLIQGKLIYKKGYILASNIDVLDPPTDIAIQFINNALHGSWKSPTTLLNVPIYGYTISISNGSATFHYYNTSTTTIQLQLMLHSCQWYNFSIYGINGAGHGSVAVMPFFYSGGKHYHENNKC